MKRVFERLLYGRRLYAPLFNRDVPQPALVHSFGLLLNRSALWIGAHYSPAHKRWCINLLPGVTLWYTKPGGMRP